MLNGTRQVTIQNNYNWKKKQKNKKTKTLNVISWRWVGSKVWRISILENLRNHNKDNLKEMNDDATKILSNVQYEGEEKMRSMPFAAAKL